MNHLITAFEKIKTTQPYVHHITNGVTMTDCANITLAAGGSPAMAHAKEEVAEMVSMMHALVLNTGTITKEVFESMLIAGKVANKLGIPIVLDPVAVGATAFRKEVNMTLLEELSLSIIRGNASEIMTLAGVTSSRGVDVALDLSFDEDKVMTLARKLKTVIATSGEVDFITDGHKKAYCHNGVAMLSEITGTGCMSASVMGVCVGAGNEPLESAILATMMMGLAGEKAFNQVNHERKLGTFHMKLIDEMAMLSKELLKSSGQVIYDEATI